MEKDNLGLKQLIGVGNPQCTHCTIIKESTGKNYHLQQIVINHYLPALFLTPLTLGQVYRPLLYCHANPANKALGKDELILGIDELLDPPYAEVLAEAGYVVLCIDNLGFGERNERSLDSYFKEYLWKGKNLWGQFVLDNLIALDCLLSAEEHGLVMGVQKSVAEAPSQAANSQTAHFLAAPSQTPPALDLDQTTVLGFSMGSTLAYWLAALDDRIKVCIELCGLTDHEWLDSTEAYDSRGFYFFVYDLFNRYTTSEINALIAPRRHVSLAGLKDPRTSATGLDRIDANLQMKYASMGAPDNWKLYKFNSGHRETEEMRKIVVDILKER